MTEAIQPIPKPLRVLVVEDDTLVGMGVKSQLERLGHVVLSQVATEAEALEVYAAQKPDLVLLDIRLEAGDGVDLAERLLASRRCPMIVLSAYSDAKLIERAGAAGVFGYLIKPVSAEALQAQIEVAVRRFMEHEQLRQEKETLAQTLETRKLMDRAKGILMKRLKLTEEDAHRRIQQESQKRRIPISDLSRKIIESEELLGNG